MWPYISIPTSSTWNVVAWVVPKRDVFTEPTNPRKDDTWYKGGDLYAIFDGKEWQLQ